MASAQAVFTALADPTRRAVFEQLTRGEAPVNALTARFEVSQPAISQHLSTLRKAGLIAQRRDGRQVFYRVEPAGLRPLAGWLAHYQAFWPKKLARLKTLLTEMDR